MVWQSLSNTLESKPRILAGPVLRKTTTTSVSVWLALRKPGKATLKVFDPAVGTQLLGGERRTVAIGTNLHIVVVTAKPVTPGTQLAEGVIYAYDLAFDFDDGVHKELDEATAKAGDTPNKRTLAYTPYDKPTFCLPPTDINKLRLLQGSCRIPHGHDDDHARPRDARPLRWVASSPQGITE